MKTHLALVAGLFVTVLACSPSEEPVDPALFRGGADAIMEDFTNDLSGQFRSVVILPEADFIAAWAAERDRWLDLLKSAPGYQAGSADAERYEARIFYEWAQGRLLYPRFHAGLTQNRDFQPSDSYDDYLGELDFSRADFLDLKEYSAFLVRKRDIDADQLLDREGDTLEKGAINLTAKRRINEAFPDDEVRCFLERQAQEDWLENYDADGLTTEPDELAARCPGEKTDELLKIVESERAEREGHAIEAYKSADGQDLEIHIYAPVDATDPLPAVLWFHGGGWYTGSWSWCGACAWFKERDMVVAQVEYRLKGRHRSTIGDSYQDTIDAIAWLRAHAEDYGIDPGRIGAAGFSAGGHLSLSAATFVTEGPARPDFAVSMSGCMDLTNDGYTIDLSGGIEKAKALSPALHPSASAPPMFVVNAVDDDTCSYGEANTFVEGARGVGADVEFLTQDGGGHFFTRDPSRVAETKAAIQSFLDEQGF